MKKTLIALSVAGFVAGSANAVTVYNNDGTSLEVSGSARVMLTKNTQERWDLNNDGSRVKFKFNQQIADGFSALGFMELRPGDEDFNGGITTKYLYAGFQADNIGTLTFGRQKTSGDAFKLADPGEQDFAINDGLGITTESEKVIRFSSASFYGLGLDASYIFDNNPSKTQDFKSKPVHKPNLNAYQVLAKYEDTFGEFGVKLHGLFGRYKFLSPLEQHPDRAYSYSVQTWGASGALSYAGLGLAVDYVDVKLVDFYDSYKTPKEPGFVLPNNGIGADLFNPNINEGFTRASGFQTALTYQVTEDLDVYGLYHRYNYYLNLGWNGKIQYPDITVKGYALGAHYNLSKNIMTYVEYNHDKLREVRETVSKNKAVYAGLRVFF